MNIRKAEQSCIKYQKEQLRIINVVCFVTLYRMGWDADKIIDRFNVSTEIWRECRDKRTSSFALLEEETGIEIALDGEKSYTDFDQLHYRTGTLTPEEYIYSLHRRKRWVAPMILACLCLALRRTDNWSDEQIAEFLSKTDEMRKEYGENIKAYVNLMIEETGYTPKIWGEG